MLYALGVGLGLDPIDEERARLRLREEPQGAADHGGGDRLSGLLGEGTRHRHRLGQGGGRRVRAHAASAARAARHRRQPHARRSRSSTRAPGKGAIVYSERTHRRQGDRRAHRHHRADHVLPRRRRLRRAAARAAAGASDPGARARSRLRSADAAGNGADLSAERRSAIRCMPTPRSRRAAGFPRPILHGLGDLRRRRPRHPQDAVRLRSGAAHGDRRALLGAGVSGRDHPHRDVARRRRGELPRPRGRARRGRDQQRPRGNQGRMREHARRQAAKIMRTSAPRCARCARTFPANTGAGSTASAAIRANSSRR